MAQQTTLTPTALPGQVYSFVAKTAFVVTPAVVLTLKSRSTSLTVPTPTGVLKDVVFGDFQTTPGEGVTFTLNCTNLGATVTAATVRVERDSDGEDVTDDFIATNSPSISSPSVTIPKIIMPSATYGKYRAEFDIEAGGWSPITITQPLDIQRYPSDLYVAENRWNLEIGEGIVFAADTSNVDGGSPSSSSASMIYETTDDTVTSTLMPLGSSSEDGNNVILPEIVIPSGTAGGPYSAKLQFNAGGFAPAFGFVAVIVVS